MRESLSGQSSVVAVAVVLDSVVLASLFSVFVGANQERNKDCKLFQDQDMEMLFPFESQVLVQLCGLKALS